MRLSAIDLNSARVIGTADNGVIAQAPSNNLGDDPRLVLPVHDQASVVGQQRVRGHASILVHPAGFARIAPRVRAGVSAAVASTHDLFRADARDAVGAAHP